MPSQTKVAPHKGTRSHRSHACAHPHAIPTKAHPVVFLPAHAEAIAKQQQVDSLDFLELGVVEICAIGCLEALGILSFGFPDAAK
jgi:hypothetical protein